MRFDARRSLAQRLNDTKVTANGTTTYRAYDAATGALSLKTIVAADKSGDTWRYGITGESYTSDHVTKAAGGAIASVTRYHADGTLDYRATYLGDVAKVVETFDAGGGTGCRRSGPPPTAAARSTTMSRRATRPW